MIEALLDKLSTFYFRFFGGPRLLPHEQLCLDAWRGTLSEHARYVLDAQLKSVNLVQRQAAGAKVCFYSRIDSSTPLFASHDPDQHVATVVMTTPEDSAKHRMPVKVFLHRGRFFSIEFPKRPERYLEQHGAKGKSLRVADVQLHQAL